jgi:Zn-dependent protease
MADANLKADKMMRDPHTSDASRAEGVAEPHPSSRGVSILGFETGSWARESGMAKGDIIIEYDGVRDLTTEKLVALTAMAKPEGHCVSVVVAREGSEYSLMVASGPLGISAVDTAIQGSLPKAENAAEISSNTATLRTAVRRISIGLIALAYKIGPKILTALVNVGKSLKVGKLGLAGTSMAAYAYIFTWEFALMIMVMLFVHESGHLWAMKRCGLKTRGMYFIPLLGAAAVPDGAFPSRGAESFIALMGPIWGLALSAVTGALYYLTENPLLAAAAGWMAALNLFNLLPISPLDGGRVFKSIAYSIGSRVGFAFLMIGLLVGGFLAYSFGMGLFVFLLIIGAGELLFEYKERVVLPTMTSIQMVHSVLAFVVVTGLLWGLMTFMKHVPGADLAMDLLQASSSHVKEGNSSPSQVKVGDSVWDPVYRVWIHPPQVEVGDFKSRLDTSLPRTEDLHFRPKHERFHYGPGSPEHSATPSPNP